MSVRPCKIYDSTRVLEYQLVVSAVTGSELVKADVTSANNPESVDVLEKVLTVRGAR
jgi:hypothetical protein